MANWQKMFLLICFLTLFSFLAGCSVAETHHAASPGMTETGQRIVDVSRQLLGAPYRYGGESPDGFDCSGLVYYVYRKIGVPVPRSSQELYRNSRKVKLAELRPGDLLFFNISRRKVSHVGIYSRANRFIHAPSSGKRVSAASLDNPYWRERLVGAGRFY